MTLATLKFSAETATLMASFGVDAKALTGGTTPLSAAIAKGLSSEPQSTAIVPRRERVKTGMQPDIVIPVDQSNMSAQPPGCVRSMDVQT